MRAVQGSMASRDRDAIVLSGGVNLPRVGLGTFKAQGLPLKAAVKAALEVRVA